MNTSTFFRLLIVLFSIYSISLTAQDAAYKTYNWEASPKLHALNSYDQSFSSIVLKETQIVELIHDNDELVSYSLIHKLIKANTDEGVMQNNRIFLPFSVNSKLLVTKARVINSKGEIKELQESDIKEGVNNETKTTYRYFALDGLDLGSEIEYILVFQQEAEYYGRSVTLQDELPKRNVEFTLLSPENLLFISKSYNNLPALQASVTPDGKNKLSVFADSIKGIKAEQFALYDPNLMQLVYKLHQNKKQDRKNIINYIDAAQTIGSLINVPVSKSTSKNLDKVIDKMNVPDISKTEEAIRAVENYVKKNFAVEEHIAEKYKPLDAVLEFKTTDKIGVTRLYAAIFEKLAIEYQIVLTTNRYENRFDKDFEAYNFLDEYLIYFPQINKYLCPIALGHRLGLIPHNFFYNYGLFVKSVKIGEFKSSIGEIKFIEPSDFTVTKHNHTVNVDFSASLENPQLSYNLMLDGYYAQPFQPYYSYTTPEQQKELDDFILKNMLPGVNVSEYTIDNKGIEALAVKPFLVNAKSNSSLVIDKAGNKFLFKIGELIGPQVEMYQEKEREFDVENDYNRSYFREITFTLPEGYKVSNPESLNMKVEMLNDGKPSCYFTSEYTVNGNVWVVKVHEDYKEIYYPKARFQEYRKVINAAADFNKIVLILEKK